MTHAEVPSPPSPSNRGWWEWIFRVPVLILHQWGYISIYEYPSVALGLTVAYIGILCGRPSWEIPLLMLVGMSLCLPCLAYYFNPDRVLERRSKQWEGWAARKLITKSELEEWKQDLHRWYR